VPFLARHQFKGSHLGPFQEHSRQERLFQLPDEALQAKLEALMNPQAAATTASSGKGSGKGREAKVAAHIEPASSGYFM
jgi:hypothetical protein